MSHNKRKIKPLEVGQLLITCNVQELINKNRLTHEEIMGCLLRHAWDDWGDIPEEDKEENRHALEHGCRILSSYKIREIKLWIITEADRSATTVLRPEDY